MKLLHRHILWNVLATCAVAVGLFAFVLILGNALKDLLSLALAGQLEPEAVVRLLLLLVPYVAAYALPMGVLTGVLLVLGRMSAQHEITAMRAAGLSLGFIARPILLLGVLGVLLSLSINFYYMPVARAAYRQTLVDSLRKDPLNLIVPRTFVRDFLDSKVMIWVGEKEGTVLRDVWIWRLDDAKRVQTFARAQSGRVDYDEAENKFVLTLSRVSAETRDDKDPENFSEPLNTAVFEEVPIELKLDQLFGRPSPRKRLGDMTLGQLVAERQQLGGEGQENARLQVSIAMHEKASSAFAVLAFAVLGIPLGIRVSRQETSANLGVALGLVLVYYFLNVIASWLEGYPAFHPDLLLWLPTVLFLGLGAWLFRRSGTT